MVAEIFEHMKRMLLLQRFHLFLARPSFRSPGDLLNEDAGGICRKGCLFFPSLLHISFLLKLTEMEGVSGLSQGIS